MNDMEELRNQLIMMNFPSLIDLALTDYGITVDIKDSKKELIENIINVELNNMHK